MDHGTYAAYQAERKANGSACPACCDAQAVYVRQWRRRTQLLDPLNALLERRPDLADMAQAGVRFRAGLQEST